MLSRSIVLNGDTHSIVGVLPEGGEFDRSFAEIWLPLVLRRDTDGPRLTTYLDQIVDRVHAVPGVQHAALTFASKYFKQRDPATMVAVGVMLTLVALTACYVPARRASRIDPMLALRHE